MKLFAVEKMYYIEDYYREYDLIGIYDTRESAEKQMEEELQKFRRQNLSIAMYSAIHPSVLGRFPEIAEIRKLIEDLQALYPVFDKTRIKDKEYQKEHTKRKHEVSAMVTPYQVRLRDIQDELVKETEAEVAKLMENIGFIERFYNGIDLDTFYGKFDKMRVKEIELNKPIKQTIARDYGEED